MPRLYELFMQRNNVHKLFNYARTEEQRKVLREIQDNLEKSIKSALSESVPVDSHHDLYMGDGIYVSIIRTGK